MESYRTISETGFNAVAYRFYVALLIMFNSPIKVLKRTCDIKAFRWGIILIPIFMILEVTPSKVCVWAYLIIELFSAF